MTTSTLACPSCGAELRATAKFCDECGSPTAAPAKSAEYKQVTVLFADVVHSMDIAATVGAERLREIMTELVDRCSAVVQRFGGRATSLHIATIATAIVRWRTHLALTGISPGQQKWSDTA